MGRLSRLGRLFTLICGLWLITHAGIATAQEQTINIGTVSQLIQAINTANKTKQQTHITVAPGHYVFSQTFNSNYGPSALPTINATILLVGADAATTIFDASQMQGRILTVLPAGNLLVRNITLTGGTACIPENCDLQGGGAALNVRGVLTFAECVITGNNTLQDGGSMDALGGGILSVGGILTLEQTTVTGNGVVGDGAGVALVGGSGSIHESIISNNSTDTPQQGLFSHKGAGIYVSSGELSIESSTISGNQMGPNPLQGLLATGIGAGIFNSGGSVTVTNSAVIGNSTINFGSGGGIYNSGGMTVENSTVAENSAATSGGGIFNSGTLLLQGVTLAGNNALGLTIEGNPSNPTSFPPACSFDDLKGCAAGGSGVWSEPGANTQTANSVLANNNGSDCAGILVSDGHNALGTNAGCTLRPSPALQGHTVDDQMNVDPRLGALQDNGVPGNAHYPLLAGSPLIDAGGMIGKFCTQLDQIGQKRIEGDGKRTDGALICDIGAIEFAPSPTP
jgi:hypothetical protein